MEVSQTLFHLEEDSSVVGLIRLTNSVSLCLSQSVMNDLSHLKKLREGDLSIQQLWSLDKIQKSQYEDHKKMDGEDLQGK